jgi:hypothetical protein
VADRPEVHFDRSRLDGYRPNETRWFSDEQRKALNAAQPNRAAAANTYARHVARRLMVDLSYASSALEGNTYSWAQTRDLIEEGINAPGKDPTDTLMILNHKKAVDFVLELVDPKDAGMGQAHGVLDACTVQDIHYLLSDGLVQGHQRGGVRQQPVEIGHSSYKPESAPQILQECLNVIVDKSNNIRDPFERSLFLLVAIPYLQPFIDVNKRTGRLCANIPLLLHGLAPFSFTHMDRKDYTNGLIRFYELGDPSRIAQAFVDSYTVGAHQYASSVTRQPDELRAMARHRAAYKGALKALGASWGDDGREGLFPEQAAWPTDKFLYQFLYHFDARFDTRRQLVIDWQGPAFPPPPQHFPPSDAGERSPSAAQPACRGPTKAHGDRQLFCRSDHSYPPSSHHPDRGPYPAPWLCALARRLCGPPLPPGQWRRAPWRRSA